VIAGLVNATWAKEIQGRVASARTWWEKHKNDPEFAPGEP